MVIDGASFNNSNSSFPFPTEAALVTQGSSEDGPKAFLNWLVFDKDYNLILAKSGYDRLSAAKRETGDDIEHERLFSPEIIIDQPGFVYIYFSNEEVNPVEVYFDDFKVTQVKSPVIASQDYYPFGLAFNSYTRENSVNQDYKYNGKELQDELELNWLDYGARMYDPTIARWMAIDPMAENSRRWTPYRYGFDNPLRFIDPDGMTEKERKKAIEAAREKRDTPYGSGKGQLDCSALVEVGSGAAGISLKNGRGVNGWANGVALIVGNSRSISSGEIREGDLATFKSGRSDHKGKDGEFDHIGIISKVGYINGKVAGFLMIHAGGSGVKEVYVDLEKGLAGFELKNFYQWDTPEEEQSETEETDETEETKSKYTWEYVQNKLQEYRNEEKNRKTQSFWDALSDKIVKQYEQMRKID